MVLDTVDFLKNLFTLKSYRDELANEKKSIAFDRAPQAPAKTAPESAVVGGNKAKKLDPKISDKKLVENNENLIQESDSTLEQQEIQHKETLLNPALPKEAANESLVKAKQMGKTRSNSHDNKTGVSADNFDLQFDKPKGNSITKAKILEPLESEYAKKLANLSSEEIYDNYNPGPTKPDGSVNFECHCVAHLVGSPCGHEFRKAITCQKNATEAEIDKGACADEFMEFMECSIKTQCFRLNKDNE